MRAQRLRERQEEYRKLRDQQFQYKTLDEITANLIEAGEIPTSTASSSTVKQKRQKTSESEPHDKEGERSELAAIPKEKKRKLFKEVAEVDIDDRLPKEFQHIRDSERKVQKGATHSQLSEVYKGLHAGLGKPMSKDFARFTKPEYSVVSDALFAGVKNSYTNEVLSSVSDVAEEHMTEVKKLTNLMLPQMQTVLARQRRDWD
ncbi:hypothetical protein Bbelb_343580 [Branchiostoma belcheri]|nr:hypothetical protein Bbelb_343580 [Branchiostoma belcheri]